jgi:pyruvate carboxylase
VTGIDIVTAQIQIALGRSLSELGISQDVVVPRGFAIQCRITTEGIHFSSLMSTSKLGIDPQENFRPDTGKIVIYRSAGGQGVRLDGGPGFAGAVISPHYDSLLVKLTCHGQTYEMARMKSLRALYEFRVRGELTLVSIAAIYKLTV